MATPKLPNHDDNYALPSALTIWFASRNDNGTLNEWRDLGNLSDVNLEMTDNYLDHKSAHNGLLADDKRVISSVEAMVNFTIDELVGCNLLYTYRPQTTPVTTATYSVLGQKRLNLDDTDAVIIDALAVEEDADDYLELDWEGVTDVKVTSADGATTYTSGVHYTFTQATGTGTARTPATIARIVYTGAGGITDNQEVVVKYRYDRETTSYVIQQGAVMEGAMRVQALNLIGPMFAWSFPRVALGVNGALNLNPEEWVSQTFAAKVLTPGSGIRGYFHLFDTFLKLAAGTSC